MLVKRAVCDICKDVFDYKTRGFVMFSKKGDGLLIISVGKVEEGTPEDLTYCGKECLMSAISSAVDQLTPEITNGG